MRMLCALGNGFLIVNIKVLLEVHVKRNCRDILILDQNIIVNYLFPEQTDDLHTIRHKLFAKSTQFEVFSEREHKR